jgi:DNA topoisomerase-1
MGQALLVVESPTKVRTIRRYLGDRFTIKATMGHVKDLPTSKLGVDVAQGFEPQYVVIPGKQKVLAEIVKAARSADAVYLAPDPDREGEAIAQHVAEELRGIDVPVHRVLFHEITKQGIRAGLEDPRRIDRSRFDSQQARRILDRLVGYELSPVLWKKVQRGLSAGRVQSVAVRLIVEREQAIRGFVPEEYWLVFAVLAGERDGADGSFRAQLTRIDGAPAKVRTADEAAGVRAELERCGFRVGRIEERTRQRRAPPPYITSRLQQDGSARFHFSARRTMQAAQQLYEGVDIGNGGPTGLITYMRTDSTRVSASAVAACREFVAQAFGAGALPAHPNVFASRAGAQDAHEAIRPTDVALTPEKVARHLAPDLAKLYGLIWRRFVASQMKPAVYAIRAVDVEATPAEAGGRSFRLRASCSQLADPGWLAVHGEDANGGEPARKGENGQENGGSAAPGGTTGARGAEDAEAGCVAPSLPQLADGEKLRLVPPGVSGEQKFTQPPPRFTEGSLVREMEELGIGRPSTYATIVSTILQRHYVRKAEQKLVPTELGELVNERLTRHFPDVLDPQFTARMEEDLDRVESSQVEWRTLLGQFYGSFHRDVEKALREMRDVRSETTETDETCPTCGQGKLIRRWGRGGWFLGCSRYPNCSFSRDVGDAPGGAATSPQPDVSGEKCHVCGKPMQVRRGRFGAFLACTGYPACKTTRPMPTGVVCPRPGCGGAVVERRTRGGRTFWECSNRVRPRGKGAGEGAGGEAGKAKGCDFVAWRRPVPQPCPRCGATYLVETKLRGTTVLACESPDCGYRAPGRETPADAAPAG